MQPDLKLRNENNKYFSGVYRTWMHVGITKFDDDETLSQSDKISFMIQFAFSK